MIASFHTQPVAARIAGSQDSLFFLPATLPA